MPGVELVFVFVFVFVFVCVCLRVCVFVCLCVCVCVCVSAPIGTRPVQRRKASVIKRVYVVALRTNEGIQKVQNNDDDNDNDNDDDDEDNNIHNNKIETHR